MRSDQLRVLERGVPGPGPAGMIHVVDFRAAECVEPAEIVERLEMLIEGAGNAVLGQEFADRAFLAFGARPVVAPDVEDQRVVFPPISSRPPISLPT